MLLLVPTVREARSLFDGGAAPRCEVPEELRIGGRAVRAALVGFGPAAAGALAALALAGARPERAVLVGIGGTLDPARLPVGRLCAGTRVVFADLGVLRGGAWRGPAALGIEQAPARPPYGAVVEELELAAPPGSPDVLPGPLLTVARASGSLEEAEVRRTAWPDALVEDMESFAVALAASRLGVPLEVVRAVSNRAGEPDRARWDVEGALAALRGWLVARLARQP